MTESNHPNGDIQKGAIEDDSPHLRGEKPGGNRSLQGQLGHRDQDELLKDCDTDFPEPDADAEHSG
ncbi:MAG: hypothetical protein ACYC46_06420 [Acidobacteriaceae bacterium]